MIDDHPPYAPHSDTSYAAAQSVRHSAPAQRQQVYATLYAHGGLTAEQISIILGIEQNSTRPRLIELRREGLVVDSGRRRRTQSKRYAVVWTVAGQESA
jgi:transcription initiation factor IIE alpha subunit